jgi:ribosomal protein S18 acetylase RimI-like enzyme
MKEETNKLNLSLRRAEAADEPFLEEVYADSRRDELAPFGWSREQEDAFFKMQFQMQSRAYQMQFPDADYYIVEFDGEPVGRLIVQRGEKEIRLVDVSLLAEFRNRGIGTFLLERLKTEAGSDRVLSLHVLKTNVGAKRLYERLGLLAVKESDLHFTMQWRNF